MFELSFAKKRTKLWFRQNCTKCLKFC